MNVWDWFVLGMFLLAIAPLVAFVFLYWRDERKKRAALMDYAIRPKPIRTTDRLEYLADAMRRYREHR